MAEVLLLPSPKFQLYDAMLPSESLDPELENAMALLTEPL
ncbi:hypothetical protein swp_3312 [Shewanella piezotolerans WP3]|uniref:Uncharacterized protein n=1 Tax=Shewanella piezotolerans (strain WP3 / JCM 13877) TaxID=225849 RepID=B8CRK7_SHEPW|nr:hypothetical protein swp_3312 [Shewanella piezotolerans WP3]